MDRKLPKDQEIQRLIRRSEIARSSLEHEAILLKQRLDFSARIRGSLKTHPAGWLIGSIASGLAASFMFRGKAAGAAAAASPKKRRGLPLTLLGLGFTAAKPFVKVWLTQQVKGYLEGKATHSRSPKPF